MKNAWLILLLLFIAIAAFGYILEYLNLKRVRRFSTVIPDEFKGKIEPDFLSKAEGYTAENTKFGIVSSLYNNAILLAFLFGWPLAAYNRWVGSLGLPFILSGLVFFIVFFFAGAVLNIPLRLYHTFVIENRYGFNVMTPGLFLIDLLKSFVVSAILLSVTVSAGLWIYGASPGLWWLWLWFFYLGLSIFLMYISPYVIEPLFNKFEPIGDPSLEESIRSLMGKVGIKVSRVFKMDASKRTSHTNAYFTGIGKVKRIVLYDTLMERLTGGEIMAVLAHEIGHWKKKHLLKGILLSEAVALGALYLSYVLLKGEFLNGLIGVSEGSFFTKVAVLGLLGSIASFPFEPLLYYISRKHEREADRFSYELTGDSRAMADALVKLSKDNLSNLHPHPLYVAFHYSHPPVVKRIEELKRTSKG